MRNMRIVKLMDRNSTTDQMQMLDLVETVDQLSNANGVRWYGHVLRKDRNNFMRGAIDFRVKGEGKVGRPIKTWLRAVIEQSRKVGQNEIDANSCPRWRLWLDTISRMMR